MLNNLRTICLIYFYSLFLSTFIFLCFFWSASLSLFHAMLSAFPHLGVGLVVVIGVVMVVVAGVRCGWGFGFADMGLCSRWVWLPWGLVCVVAQSAEAVESVVGLRVWCLWVEVGGFWCSWVSRFGDEGFHDECGCGFWSSRRREWSIWEGMGRKMVLIKKSFSKKLSYYFNKIFCKIENGM